MAPLSGGCMSAIIVAYGVALFAVTWLSRKRDESAEGFVVADRSVGLGLGAASILATWTAGSSLYIPAQCGYRYGVAGPLIWSLGGVLMLCAFLPVVPRIRAILPEGHTLPEYLGARFGTAVHLLVTLKFLLLTPVGLYFQLAVPAYLVSTFSPLSFETGLLLVGAIVTSYTLISGLKASILTDYIQFAMISLLGIVIAPVVFHRSGGAPALAAALPSLGEKGSVFSRSALLMLGVPFLIQSLSCAFALPYLWQRVWAIKRSQLRGAFLAAGIGWFPYSLAFGTFGVLALAYGISSQAGEGNDICPLVAARYLPPGLALAFVVVVISAAASTCDSFLSAFSSIAMTDVWRRYIRPAAADAELLLVGRVAMVVCMAAGIRIAVAQFEFIEMIWIMGAINSGMIPPLVASLWWPRVGPVGFIAGTLLGGAAGIAANILTRGASPLYAAFGLLTALCVGAAVCAICALLVDKGRFDFASLRQRVGRLG